MSHKKIEDVVDIIADYLRHNGFDGLAGDNCGCSIEDIGACDTISCSCQPAYRHIKPDCENCEIECDAKGEGRDCFRTDKPEPPAEGKE